MGLLTPLATVLSGCGTLQGSERLIRQGRHRSTWPGCPPASGPKDKSVFSYTPFLFTPDSHSLTDQLKEDQVRKDGVLAQAMGRRCGWAKGTSKFARKTLQDGFVMTSLALDGLIWLKQAFEDKDKLYLSHGQFVWWKVFTCRKLKSTTNSDDDMKSRDPRVRMHVFVSCC